MMVAQVTAAGDAVMPPTNIEISLENLRKDVTTIAESGARPIILGGDHSISYANITGIADAIGRKKFGVIHFDAHPDTADVDKMLARTVSCKGYYEAHA